VRFVAVVEVEEEEAVVGVEVEMEVVMDTSTESCDVARV
jgi:hypothetical protein